METQRRSRTPQVLGLVGWLLASYATAALGGLAAANAGTFFLDLARPVWAPPAWVFGPVWTALYTLMAIAAWRVWRLPPSADRSVALEVYGVQLIANALWSWIFFAWHLGGVALAEIIWLLALIALTIRDFRRVDRSAAWLLVPYLLWVSFAALLNLALWLMNPTVL